MNIITSKILTITVFSVLLGTLIPRLVASTDPYTTTWVGGLIIMDVLVVWLNYKVLYEDLQK